MRDIADDVAAWLASGQRVAVATVVATWGSAPRRPGAKMAVASGGGISGSVSGGCVEGAVVDAAREVLAGGPPRRLRFGVGDESAWSVGLACGGSLDVFVERLDPAAFDVLRRAAARDEPIAAVTAIAGPDGALGRKAVVRAGGEASGDLPEGLAAAAREAAREALARGEARLVSAGGAELFADPVLPPPTLVVVGAVHVAVALVALARTLGFRTVVVDPRGAFATPERFPAADRLVSDWPDAALRALGPTASTAVAVLTHDPKLDDPALTVALPSPAFYVGALGSARTQAKRRERLLAAGLSENDLARLKAPIGLPLGGRAPEEIALAVMAEIVAARNRVETSRPIV